MGNHVDIVITAGSVSPERASFGRMAVPSYFSGLTEDTLFTSASAVATFFGADSFEAAVATAHFAQNPRPRDILFAKFTLPPTKVYTLRVEQVLDEHAYQIRVKGKGVTTTLVTSTSDNDASDAEIVADLVTKLNAVTGANFTAAGASSPFTVTADDPGNYFCLEILDRDDLSMEQTHTDPGYATDLAAFLLRNSSWYWLYVGATSSACMEVVADWADANGKLFIAEGSDTIDATDTSDGDTGALDDLADEGHERSAGFWHHREYECAGAALVGNLAPRTPGSWTAKFKTLSGISVPTLTPNERANLIARFANFVESDRGVKIVVEGTTAAGPTNIRGFIDNVVSLDWLQDDMEAAVFAAMAGAAKIPRTDKGMVVISGAVRGSLRRGVSNGMIAELAAEDNDGTASPNVVVPLVADMEDLLPRGVRLSFSFKLAGAIHHADVTGVVTL